MKKLRVLDLFSGIGGFSLGLERTGGFETVAFCEIEDFPRRVLNKHWPDVPCLEDVRKLKGQDVGPVDLICGGYPCQPFSTAGKRLGERDDRHLWPEFARLISELRPAWIIGENVAGHISMGLDDVLSDLEALGYSARPFVIPACAVDAKHRRDRIWTVAHAGSDGHGFDDRSGKDSGQTRARESEKGQRERVREIAGGMGASVPYASRERSQGQGRAINAISAKKASARQEYRALDDCRWSAEPNVGRVANGVPHRVDRLKALGNAVVPQIPELIGHAILEAMQ